MENEELNNAVSQQENVTDNVDYIEAIKEMKQNTVDKATYNKLKEENKQLLNSLANGETIDVPKKEEVDIDALRKDLFNNDQRNLQYIEKALKLREALLEKGEKDPFLPYGKNIIPTDEDIATADRVARVLQECVDYADGDSDIFTNELQRITVDTAPQRKQINRR